MRQRTLITAAPLTTQQIQRLINRYYALYGTYPEKIVIARDGGKPIIENLQRYAQR